MSQARPIKPSPLTCHEAARPTSAKLEPDRVLLTWHFGCQGHLLLSGLHGGPKSQLLCGGPGGCRTAKCELPFDSGGQSHLASCLQGAGWGE